LALRIDWHAERAVDVKKIKTLVFYPQGREDQSK
jgi:hypothetical protein